MGEEYPKLYSETQERNYHIGERFHLTYSRRKDTLTDQSIIEILGPHPNPLLRNTMHPYCLIKRSGEHGSVFVDAPHKLPEEVRTVLASEKFPPEIQRMLRESLLVSRVRATKHP